MPQEEQQLVAQGVKDYVDVLNAMSAFRLLVQGIFRRVVEANLNGYGTALGIDLSKRNVMDNEWSDGDELTLGVRYVDKRIAYTELGQALYWDRVEGGFETGIIMWVWSRKGRIERLREVLRQKAVSHEGGTGRAIWLAEEITAENVGQIDTKLDALMDKWIKLWRKAGGLKALGGKSS